MGKLGTMLLLMVLMVVMVVLMMVLMLVMVVWLMVVMVVLMMRNICEKRGKCFVSVTSLCRRAGRRPDNPFLLQLLTT